jgi:hypothetical protein
MGRGLGISIALIVALAPLAASTCGDATEHTQAAAGGSGGMNERGKRDPKWGAKGGTNGPVDAGAGGADGAFDAAADSSGHATPTDPIDPGSTCSICVRAENCCKAQGLTDCDYGSACANATPLEQQFYLVLCGAMIEASRDGGNVPPDVCGF